MIKVALVVCCLPGLSMLAYAVIVFIKDMRARRWPTVDGRLMHIKVRSVGYRGMAKTNFSYDYEVAGQKYTGTRYSFGYLAGGIVGGGEVYAKIKRDLQHRPGVKVFYNPSYPRESVLVPGATWIHLINLLVSGVFLVLVFLITSHTYRG